MGVVVRKSPVVIVRPSAPVPTGNIDLSPYDVPLLTISPPAMLFVFDYPIPEPIESIKRALSRALVYYHAFTGRLGGEPVSYIRCPTEEEGVPFLGASADCTIKDIKSFDQSLLQELAIYYPGGVCGFTDPLLTMQVTQFSCGGFVLAATWNHVVADGYGMAQFIQAVGELARGLPSPSVVSVRWDAAVMGRPTPDVHDMNVRTYELALQDITISSSLISRIKHSFLAHSKGRRSCTVCETVIAVLWQCRTRAIMSDPEALTAVILIANTRKYVGAKDGYYGNCFTGKVVMATSGAVANGNVMDLIKMIQSTKGQLSKERSSNNSGEGTQSPPLEGYNALAISSLRNLGFDHADFGGGRPARVVSYTRGRMVPLPTCLVLPPPKEKVDGTKMLSVSVKEQHAEAFLTELGRFELLAMAKL